MIKTFANSMDAYFEPPTHSTVPAQAIATTAPKSVGGGVDGKLNKTKALSKHIAAGVSNFLSRYKGSNLQQDKQNLAKGVIVLSLCILLLQAGVGEDRNKALGVIFFMTNIFQFAMLFKFFYNTIGVYTRGDYVFTVFMSLLFGCTILINAGYVSCITPSSLGFLIFGKFVLTFFTCATFILAFDLPKNEIWEVYVLVALILITYITRTGSKTGAKVIGILGYIVMMGFEIWKVCTPHAAPTAAVALAS
jgi:hypothetical protein